MVIKMIVTGKRDFIQHTSKYLKLLEEEGQDLVITHHNRPALKIVLIREKTLSDLKGIMTHLKIQGDINQHILPGYDKWS